MPPPVCSVLSARCQKAHCWVKCVLLTWHLAVYGTHRSICPHGQYSIYKTSLNVGKWRYRLTGCFVFMNECCILALTDMLNFTLANKGTCRKWGRPGAVTAQMQPALPPCFGELSDHSSWLLMPLVCWVEWICKDS